MSEGWAADVAVHRPVRIELRMIECIEGFETKFERFAFGDFRRLTESDVKIIDARSVEEPPGRCSGRAQSIRGEERRVEKWKAVSRVAVDLQGSGMKIRQINTNGIDPVILYINQCVVAETSEGDRQACRKTSDAGYRPSLSQTVRRAEQFLKRQLVVVADDEIVFDIER